MEIGIVGYGAIGKALARLFQRSTALRVHIFDKYIEEYASTQRAAAVDRCAIVFIAVPTPYDASRQTCDVSAVIDVVGAISAPMCIKSTIPPGTTDALIRQTGKRIAVSPEYAGESQGHPWSEVWKCGFLILGGDIVACGRARQAFELASPVALNVVETTAAAAELVKYMENSFLATKVAFMNEFFDLATVAGVEFGELRKLFLLDNRVGASHTLVTRERGFGGKCLPKDLRSIIAWSRLTGGARLLEAVSDYNDSLRAENGVTADL
jgi:UDPglucose 6-dehydrogenase